MPGSRGDGNFRIFPWDIWRVYGDYMEIRNITGCNIMEYNRI
jgi:hypothetical protein